MKDIKRLKDPIYGYINIPSKLMSGIVDSSCFQRLRRIIQTSYSPLYSSAVHNRFVHSLGVFHLGKIASSQIVDEIKNKCSIDEESVSRLKDVFLIACLLHDVGHAPFSHTGEEFYLDDDKNYTSIHEQLINEVQSDGFAKDVPDEKTSSAAPHEIMSAIVGLKTFPELFFSADEREFFARCIIGYRYSDGENNNRIKNCFIELLNSKVIDVDKLDYLIRDAYITGFDTVNIDYMRLLKALTVIENGDNYELAYYKDAISVIENVIYAHDAERKWIQGHPIVLYETYILQHIISHICCEVSLLGKKLFCSDALSDDGIKIKENVNVRLMSDDDIIYLIKNVFPNKLGEEYFARVRRRHPVWKSEAEYKAVFLAKTSGGEILDRFADTMSMIAKYLVGSSDTWSINDQMLDKLKEELVKIESKDELDNKTKEVQIRNKKKIIELLEILKKYAIDEGVEFDFIIIKATQFNSGFGKPDFSNINICFPQRNGKDKFSKVGKIVSSLQAKEKDGDDYFYLFYKRAKEGVELDRFELCDILIREFV